MKIMNSILSLILLSSFTAVSMTAAAGPVEPYIECRLRMPERMWQDDPQYDLNSTFKIKIWSTTNKDYFHVEQSLSEDLGSGKKILKSWTAQRARGPSRDIFYAESKEDELTIVKRQQGYNKFSDAWDCEYQDQMSFGF